MIDVVLPGEGERTWGYPNRRPLPGTAPAIVTWFVPRYGFEARLERLAQRHTNVRLGLSVFRQ